MNTLRVAMAIKDIEENTAALKWLEEYGPQIDPRNKDHATVTVAPSFAGACPGAKEAAKVLSNFARLSLADIIAQSIRNCRNTIEMAKSAIREEVGRDAE